jgi:CBS domain-containing protein
MQEHSSGVRTDAKPHRSLFERLTALISPEPENRAELLDVLHDAHERNLIDADALSMIEGVFQVSDLSARDIMVPRSQMDVIDISKPIEEWLPSVLSTAHSRFPAVEGERDKVIGILLAKDLLRYYAEESFDVRDMLRPAHLIAAGEPQHGLGGGGRAPPPTTCSALAMSHCPSLRAALSSSMRLYRAAQAPIFMKFPCPARIYGLPTSRLPT